ncbi:ROK family transcriptional regulator [Actinomyces sp.]|uniref:ROK family transcriptional regulator n=1 Tax=Actinomyces sp. TaxID=29317 RepID=UPI00289EF399|nr:ROK family transcriptional regulator [Actinomyces sp.]
MSGNIAAPGSQSSLREANSARIVDTVKRYGRITQVELASATGLSAATVSNIVKQLTSQGVVQTQTTIRSGRRAQLVTLARSTGLALGIEVGRRQMRLELSDAAHESTAHQHLPLPVDHRVDTTLDRAALLVMELTEGIGATLDDVIGVGVSLPAPVDPVTGLISVPGIMPGWDDVDVGEVLRRRLNRPVVVDNDANAGALGESRFGALRGVAMGIYVRCSYMTGGGIIMDGHVLHGDRGIAGEIGHVQVDPTGPICRCGSRGCLNTIVGADMIVDLLRLTRGRMSLQDVIHSANEGDPGCRQVIQDAGSAIGNVLADLCMALAPTVIVVGGELAQTGETLLSPIRDAVGGRPLLGGKVEVVPSELGDRAEVLGALAMAQDAGEPAYVHKEAIS